MYFYAQLGENKICNGVFFSEIPQKGFVELETLDHDLIGMKYENQKFTEIVAPQTILTLHDFRSRFTFDEKVAIKASPDPGAQVVQEDLTAANVIDLDNRELQEGLAYLVNKGLISKSRKTEILTPAL
ncbi:MAG: hypothetical protein JEZ12_22905 [Desulfobacterium sp.]|nr:hypothetical protein [Desulfobacterium sp.]